MQSQNDQTLTQGFGPSHAHLEIIRGTDKETSIHNPTETGLDEHAAKAGPSGSAEQDRTYHPSEVQRAHDPQYLHRMEIQKLPFKDVVNKYMELHEQNQVLGQSKNQSDRRVTDESHDHPVQSLRPDNRLHPARNVQLEYEKRVDSQVILNEARARTIALTNVQEANVQIDHLRAQLGTGDQAYHDFRLGLNKAVTEAVSAFTEQTTGVALAVIETIARETSALHKPPFTLARTAADQGADLQAALTRARTKPLTQKQPTRSLTPQRPHTDP